MLKGAFHPGELWWKHVRHYVSPVWFHLEAVVFSIGQSADKPKRSSWFAKSLLTKGRVLLEGMACADVSYIWRVFYIQSLNDEGVRKLSLYQAPPRPALCHPPPTNHCSVRSGHTGNLLAVCDVLTYTVKMEVETHSTEICTYDTPFPVWTCGWMTEV